jgi:hypothetical protein
MTFAYKSDTWPSLLAHDLSSYIAVTDIRFSAETLNARCITAIDANIVKHSGFFEKLGI